jgi:hypothetical protein
VDRLSDVLLDASASVTPSIHPAMAQTLVFEDSWYPRNLTKFPASKCPNPCPTLQCPFSVPGNDATYLAWHNVVGVYFNTTAEILSAGIPCNIRDARDSRLLVAECANDPSFCEYGVFYILEQEDLMPKFDELLENLTYLSGRGAPAGKSA